MTGKELLIYIIDNDLYDNDIEEILEKAFRSEEEIAEYFKVACPTVRAWLELGKIDGIKFGNKYYISEKEFERIKAKGVK